MLAVAGASGSLRGVCRQNQRASFFPAGRGASARPSRLEPFSGACWRLPVAFPVLLWGVPRAGHGTCSSPVPCPSPHGGHRCPCCPRLFAVSCRFTGCRCSRRPRPAGDGILFVTTSTQWRTHPVCSLFVPAAPNQRGSRLTDGCCPPRAQSLCPSSGLHLLHPNWFPLAVSEWRF